MRANPSRSELQKHSALHSLLVIVMVEWKRFVLTYSFVFIAVVPPCLILIYPTTYEFVSSRIQNWNAEQSVSYQFAGTSQGAVKTVDALSANNVIRYAVVDRSTWVQQSVNKKLLKTDLQTFLETISILNESEFVNWAQTVVDDLTGSATKQDRSFYLANWIEFHHSLTNDALIQEKALYLAERLLDTEDFYASDLPTDSVLTLWKTVPGKITQLVPLLSFASFNEVDVGNRSLESVESMLHAGKITGYFIIPDDISENNEGLQLVTLPSFSEPQIDDLKNFFQSLLAQVLRERELLRIESSSENDQPYLLFRWHEKNISHVALDSYPRRNHWWGSPTKITTFVTNHLSVIVSFIILLCVFMSSPAFAISTVEERTSKLAETLLANVDASLLLDGKVWGGLAAIGTAMGCWLVLLVIYALTMTPDQPFELLQNVQVLHLIHCLFFLFTAFALNGYIVVSFGSVCNNQFDAAVTLIPLIMLYCLAAMILYVQLENPSAGPALMLSFIPPFTPFIMIGRTGYLPEWPMYFLTVVLMLVSVIAARSIGSSFFSRAILVEQRPRGIKEMIRLKSSRS